MSRLLRSIEFTQKSCCWQNNIFVGFKAIAIAFLFVLFGFENANAQNGCDIDVFCPATVILECGDDYNDLDLTGMPTFATTCTSVVDVNYADNSVGTGCHVIITRTWTASVVGGPSNSCTQIIHVIDTQGPVFNMEPADISVECEGEIETPLLSTTDCNPGSDIIIFDSNTGGDSLFCELTTPLGPGPDWAVWLNGLTGLGLAANDYYTWIPGSATMTFMVDGTAHITGDVQNMSNPGQTWNVSFWMENGKNWTDWSALGRSYKDDLGFGALTHFNWSYYELVPVFSHFVGTGLNAGSFLYLSHQPTNYYFGFQFGQGANNRNGNEGGSGWFYYTGVVNGQNVSNHGDLTTDKTCVPVGNPFDICNGELTRFWRATDACGNVTMIDQVISIHDTTPPVFDNCYPSIDIECGDDVPGALPAEGLSATDNCGEDVVIDLFSSATINISECHWDIVHRYRAVDVCGNEAFCDYVIHVIDTTAPVLTVPADATYECDEIYVLTEATAVDACQGVVDVVEGETNTIQNECGYQLIRLFTADDGCGNISTGTQTITITDSTPPVFDPFTAQIYVECDMIDSVELLTAHDNCDLDVTVTYEDITNSGGCLGVIMRTYTATDDCGNTTVVVQFITILDNTPPVIEVPGDMIAECDDVPAAPGVEGAIVYDNCGMAVTVEFHTEMMEGPCANSYTILWIWEAWDYCDNYSTDTTTITVVDSTPPVLSLPEGGVFSCEDGITYGDATATDNCDDDVEISFTDLMVDGECPQSYSVVRTYVAVDNCGNETTGSVTYFVIDNVAPFFTSVPENITIECNEDVPASMATAEDLCGVTTVTSDDQYEFQSTCYTLIIRTFTATDQCNNSSYATQTITILDTTPPVIAYEPEISLPCDDYMGIFATATDLCDESVSVEWIADEFVSGGCQGRIIRTYGAWDDCQNYAEVQQIITLTDNIPPYVIEQSPDATVECGTELPEVFVSFGDNCDDELTYFSGVFTETIDCITYYTYTFSATDNCENTTSENVVITIVDTQNPWFESLPEDMWISCDDEVPAIVIPIAYDLCDDDVDVEVADDIIPGNCPHSYTIVRVYRAFDDCGHQTVESRLIHVTDEEAPVFGQQQVEYSYECDELIPVIQPTAIDDCGEVTYEHTDDWANESHCNGLLIRTWSATDECFNTSYFTQYISIYDNTPPVIDAMIEVTMPCDDIDNSVLATATDNCDPNPTVVIYSQEAASGSCAGRLIRIYRAYDECENYSEFTQFITLTDTEAPIASIESYDATYECDELWLIPSVTFTDNCDENLDLTANHSIEEDGCTTIHHWIWTAIDHCDNATTVIVNITVTDTTPPTVDEPGDFEVECGQFYDLVVPNFMDNCDDELTYGNDFNEEMVGCNYVYTYIWWATDNCGNTTTVDQVVTVVDTTPPTLVVPIGGDFDCVDGITYGEAFAFDICDQEVDLTFTDVMTPGACPQSYTVVRTWVAIDDCQNVATGSAEYNVYDLNAPVFTFVPENITIECSDEIPASSATADDDCDDEVIYGQMDEYEFQSLCYTLIIRTFSAADHCGNVAYATQLITILDTTDPVISGEFEIEMPCDDISEGIFVTATDNCDDDVYIEIVSSEMVSGGCAGRIIRIYRAWDNCQNYSEFTQFITLTDDTPPVASIDPLDMTYECGEEWSPASVTFTDNCDMELILLPDLFITSDACITTYHYIWTAIDHCENVTTVDQIITVVDTTAPVIFAENSEITVDCNVAVDYITPDAYDACDGIIEVVPTYTSTPGDCPGEYNETLTFTATDACGNSSSVSFITHHVDNTPPMLENIPQGGEYSCEETLPNDMPTAFDYCSEATVMSSELTIDGNCPNSYVVVRTFWAVDECQNVSESVNVYYSVYDNTAPSFDNSVSDESYQCLDWSTYEVQVVTATDLCGEATVTHTITPMQVDNCGNGVWFVEYVAADQCFNYADIGYYITIEDTQAPELSSMPVSIMLDCDDEIPAPAIVTASDNCDNNVEVVYTETCLGDCPVDGESNCDLLTPVRPVGNPCAYPVDWAMALFGMPSAHKWYQLIPGSGTLVHNLDGSLTLTGSLVNAYNAGCGFNFNVTFANPLDWAAWSSQAFPTGFKADCGGVGANHTDWMYYILQNGPGAELTGWGAYAGSSIDLSHAPSNQYFGFQLGDGANNYNGVNGLGGWFSYSGVFLVNGEPIMSGNVGGAGDFAFEIDCCPDYQIVRCWTAMDCSGNEVSHCQTITFGDLNNNFNPAIAQTPSVTNTSTRDISILNIAPNPASYRSQITFMSKNDERLSLQILDMTGRVVADLFNSEVVAGVEYRADFDADKIPAGMYMVRLNSSSERDISRMQIAR